jgi:hypothetical protein
MTSVAEMRYSADITAGALKMPECWVVARLLLKAVDDDGWREAIVKENVLQARTTATAIRLRRLIRKRLEMMDADLWKLVRDGNSTVATTQSWRRRSNTARSSATSSIWWCGNSFGSSTRGCRTPSGRTS